MAHYHNRPLQRIELELIHIPDDDAIGCKIVRRENSVYLGKCPKSQTPLSAWDFFLKKTIFKASLKQMNDSEIWLFTMNFTSHSVTNMSSIPSDTDGASQVLPR